MLLRSLLFVPGNRLQMIGKAFSSRSDAVIIDLEDGVPITEKDAARQIVREWAEGSILDRSPIAFVRINTLSSGQLELDLRSILRQNVTGVCLPKAECGDSIEKLCQLLDKIERERGLEVGSTRILPLIESTKGVLKAYEIASASSRIVALAFGAEDYTFDLGTQRSREGTELFFARSLVAIAARAAETVAIDTIYTDISDDDGLRQEVRLARQLGFTGKLLIHPRQIDIVNQSFLPSEEDLAYAKRVIAAFSEAQKEGTGVISLDEKMIDMPVVKRAERIVGAFDRPGET